MLRNLVFWLAVIRRVVSIAALVIVVCACSEAPRTRDLAACSLEAERTYPFGNEAFMSRSKHVNAGAAKQLRQDLHGGARVQL